MIFEIEEIPEGGLNFEVLEAKEHFGIDQSDCALSGDVKVWGKLTKVEREVLCSCDFNAPLLVVCTRCLEKFPLQVRGKLQIYFIPQVKEHRAGSEVEVQETDIEKEVYQEDQIDLRGPVRDQILLDVPLIRLCRKNCKGLCPKCGIDLNSSQCECKNDGPNDPRFAVLQKLKDKLK